MNTFAIYELSRLAVTPTLSEASGKAPSTPLPHLSAFLNNVVKFSFIFDFVLSNCKTS